MRFAKPSRSSVEDIGAVPITLPNNAGTVGIAGVAAVEVREGASRIVNVCCAVRTARRPEARRKKRASILLPKPTRRADDARRDGQKKASGLAGFSFSLRGGGRKALAPAKNDNALLRLQGVVVWRRCGQKNEPNSTERMLNQDQRIRPTTTTMGKPWKVRSCFIVRTPLKLTNFSVLVPVWVPYGEG